MKAFVKAPIKPIYQRPTDNYIGPPIFDLLNIDRYTYFHRYFGVLVYSVVCS